VTIEGPYLVLLRIEASDDKEGDSNLAVVGAGPGVVHSGAVAGFPMPVLRYFVGGGQPANTNSLRLLLPAENAQIPAAQTIEFSWTEIASAALYQLEVADEAGQVVLAAMLQPATLSYRAPSFLREKAANAGLQWRVIAIDQSGAKTADTPWRRLQFTN
jgi:hypothetical protein